MGSPNDEGSSSRQTPISAKEQSILNRLRKMSQPLRSTPFRSLISSNSSVFRSVKPSTATVTTANGKNPDEIASWMSSIRQRAKAALLQDDNYELETENEIAKSRDTSQFYDDDDDNDINELNSQSFAQLGEILSNHRKRPDVFDLPLEKKQKVRMTFFFFFFFDNC